jgi:hypothetical protein
MIAGNAKKNNAAATLPGVPDKDEVDGSNPFGPTLKKPWNPLDFRAFFVSRPSQAKLAKRIETYRTHIVQGVFWGVGGRTSGAVLSVSSGTLILMEGVA